MAIEFDASIGSSSSTTYIDIAYFKQYWENRGVDYSSLTDDTIKGLLNRATEYIDSNYHFKGEVVSTTQSLSFPRYNIYDKNNTEILSTIIPVEVKKATSEIASEIYITDTNNGNYTSANQKGEGIKSKSIGVMSITYSNNASGNGSTFKRYPEATNYLKPFISKGVRC